MFKNYLMTSLRFLASNKSFSLLNVIGLSIGTLCCIYILVYVREQYSYDRYFSNAENIYRVTNATENNSAKSNIRLQATTPPALAATLQEEYSDNLLYTQYPPSSAPKNNSSGTTTRSSMKKTPTP